MPHRHPETRPGIELIEVPMRAVANRCMVIFLLFALAGVARPADGPAIDPVWLAKANADGAAILEKYQAILGFLDETNEVRVEPESAGGLRTMTNHSVRFGANTLLERGRFFVDPSKQPMISLECDNSDYYFGLEKIKEDTPFVLNEYSRGERKLPLWKQASGLHGEVFYQLKSALEALAPDNRANLRTVRFDPATALLTIEHVGVKKNIPFTEKLAIDPAQGWIIKERRYDNSNVLATAEYTYGTVIEGLTFPTGSILSTTLKVKIPNAPLPSRIVVRVLNIKRTDMTAADFRLSAFGFPEPIGIVPPPRPTRWYVWILASAGGCAVLALGFAYLRRRQVARAATIPGGTT